MGMLLAGRDRPDWELGVPGMRTWSWLHCDTVWSLCPRQLGQPGRCQPGVSSAELLLGKDTRDGLGPLPPWKLLPMVMRPIWESSHTAPGNVLSPCGCRSWTRCHSWALLSLGSPEIPCSVIVLGPPSHQTVSAMVVWK